METLEENANQSSQTESDAAAEDSAFMKLLMQRGNLESELIDISNRLKPIEKRKRLLRLALLERVYGEARHSVEIKVCFSGNRYMSSGHVGIIVDERMPVHLSISPTLSRVEVCVSLQKVIAQIECEIGEELWKEAAELAAKALEDANFARLVCGDCLPF